MSWTLNKEIIKEFVTNPEESNFVETGTYKGGGVRLALDLGFKRIYSCDLSPRRYKNAVATFAEHPNVALARQHSVEFLQSIMGELSDFTVFWLDAHGANSTPVLEELETLHSYSGTRLILIDDIRLFRRQDLWAKGVTIETLESKAAEFGEIIYRDSKLFPNDILVCCQEVDPQQPGGRSTITNERKRLIEQYRLKHEKFPDYGPSLHYHDKTIKLMQRFDCKTLLDFGCGKGRLVEKIDAMPEFEAVGYDPAIKGREELPTAVFDCVTCLDVAEHWAPDAISAEFIRIRERCGKICLFAICCRPAVHHLPDGTNCHTSLHTAEQWMEFIDEHFRGWRRIEEKWHEKQKTLILVLANPNSTESDAGD